MTRLTLLAARGHDGVIGVKDRLPWRLRSDLEWFKSATLGHYLIVGRKTYDALPVRLLGRWIVVVSRTLRRDHYQRLGHDNVTVASSIQDAIAVARAGSALLDVERAFIIGGALIYTQALPLVDDMWITEVDSDAPGTAHLRFDASAWSAPQLISVIKASVRDEHDASIVSYQRLETTRSL